MQANLDPNNPPLTHDVVSHVDWNPFNGPIYNNARATTDDTLYFDLWGGQDPQYDFLKEKRDSSKRFIYKIKNRRRQWVTKFSCI